MDQDSKNKCPLCEEEIKEADSELVKFSCKHKFCINCHTKKIKNSLQSEKKACCPEENCGQTLTIDNLHQLGLRRKYLELFEEGREKDKKNGNDYMELFQCLICLEAKEKKEFTILHCKHEFCTQCLLEFFKAKIISNQCDLMCPTCHKEINFFL